MSDLNLVRFLLLIFKQQQVLYQVSLPLHFQKSRFLVARCLEVVVYVRIRALFIHKTYIYIYIYIYKGAADARINLQFYKTIKYSQVSVDVRMDMCFIRP